MINVKFDEVFADTYLPISLNTTHNIDEGGRACTKSSKNAGIIVFTMLKFKDCEAIVVRQDAVHHRNSTLKELLIACERFGLVNSIHYKYTVSPMEITFYNGSKIFFGALNDYEKLKGFKPSSNTKYFGLIWFFEYTEFKSSYEMEQAISTFSRGGNKKVFKVLYEANPSADAYHWTYDWLKKVKNQDDYKYTFRTYLDLTEKEQREWLGKYIIKQIDNLKQIDIEQYNHIYLGLPRTLENAVYKNKPKFVERPKKFDYILVGLDYGEADATTAVAVGVARGKYYIFNQYYHSGRKDKKKNIIEYKSEIAEWINEIYEQEKVPMEFYIETSPMTVYTLFTADYEIKKSIVIKKVDKAKTLKRKTKNNINAIQERIDVTNIMINSDVLFICDESLQINKAFAQALYKKRQRLDDGTTDIDSLDAFEYAIKVDFKKILNTVNVDID